MARARAVCLEDPATLTPQHPITPTRCLCFAPPAALLSCCLDSLSPAAAKPTHPLRLLRPLSPRFARARQAENPDMADVYERKLAAMAADAERNRDSTALDENERRLTGLLDAAETRLAAAGPQGWLAGTAYSQADVLFSVVLWRIAMAKQQSRCGREAGGGA